MASPDALPRLRGAGLARAVLLGLLLAFGGMCGAGPTSLPLIAVSSSQVPTPDDARGNVPVPAEAEVAQPSRRLVQRRGLRRLVRTRPWLGAGRVAEVAAALVHLRAPPLRGPPALAA